MLLCRYSILLCPIIFGTNIAMWLALATRMWTGVLWAILVQNPKICLCGLVLCPLCKHLPSAMRTTCPTCWMLLHLGLWNEMDDWSSLGPTEPRTAAAGQRPHVPRARCKCFWFEVTGSLGLLVPIYTDILFIRLSYFSSERTTFIPCAMSSYPPQSSEIVGPW